MKLPIRRVVTGHNADGKSIFVMDGPGPDRRGTGTAGVTPQDLWKTFRTPVDNAGIDEALDGDFRLPPPQGGSVFRVVEYPPDSVRLATLAKGPDTHDESSGMTAARDKNNPRHPGFHKTDTIDYAIVLSGEIWAMMDEGETLLKQGDVLVQRGTNHAWSNRTNEPAILAFVLIDADPV